MSNSIKENNLRFQIREKVACVISKTTFLIKAVAINFACQFEKRWDGKSFAWIYGSEEMDSDPLNSKTIWGFNGSGHLNVINLTNKSKCLCKNQSEVYEKTIQ